MGGKRKIKWRKLPLEEFTSKECNTTEKKNSTDGYKIAEEEEKQTPMPLYDDSSEINYLYNEYRENTDGILYTSPYVIYNTVYPNYVMPEDPRYYYYLPPDMTPVQEYTPIPYQDYVPPMKDTVYLLFPAPNVTSHQGPPHPSYDWRNRRRRRRYEGYAEYAVIDRNNPSGVEDRDQKKGTVPSGKNDNQFSHGRMTTCTENNSSSRDSSKRFPDPNRKNTCTNDEKRNVKKSMSKLGEEKKGDILEKNANSWKNNDLCKVHTTKSPEKCDSSLSMPVQNNTSVTLKTQEDKSEKSGLQSEMHSSLSSTTTSNTDDNGEIIVNDACASNKSAELCKNVKDLQLQKETAQNSINELTEVKLDRNSEKNKDFPGERSISEVAEKNISPSEPLPDVVNILKNNSLTNNNIVNNKTPQKSDEPMGDRESEKTFKSILSQSPYLHHPLTSDSFSNETEAELKKLRMLQSLKTDQSIYKLAYDEDQSNSRSPSPIDPESQVPSSLPNSEILIHEADSGSEAGSEDVELISHRYESESSLNENKHMYVNKLSLAVELLRTQENLPYDDQFKRVVGENKPALNEAQKDITGEINFSFEEDLEDNFDNSTVVTTQSEASRHLINDKDNQESESCEVAKEMVETVNPVREGVANRRFQVPFRHYFSARNILVNPCSCCIIM